MCYPLRFWVLAKVLNTADISEVKRNYAHFSEVKMCVIVYACSKLIYTLTSLIRNTFFNCKSVIQQKFNRKEWQEEEKMHTFRRIYCKHFDCIFSDTSLWIDVYMCFFYICYYFVTFWKFKIIWAFFLV